MSTNRLKSPAASQMNHASPLSSASSMVISRLVVMRLLCTGNAMSNVSGVLTT
jgi:hypothetical protein